MAGASASRSTVLMFLDAHCEMVVDWLRPLLQRMAAGQHLLVTPLIDTLNQRSMQYHNGGHVHFQVICHFNMHIVVSKSH